jgi:hypothetical protein
MRRHASPRSSFNVRVWRLLSAFCGSQWIVRPAPERDQPRLLLMKGQAEAVGEIGGDVVDQFGQPVNERSFGPRHLLVLFGFSHCAVVCPRELSKLGAALGLLGPSADPIQPLYITVDPARDSAQVLGTHLARGEGLRVQEGSALALRPSAQGVALTCRAGEPIALALCFDRPQGASCAA